MQTGLFQPSRSVIRVNVFDEEASYAPYTCLQCDEAWCMQACPVNAIAVDAVTGAKVVLDKVCVGCHLCSIACPFGTVFTLPGSNKAGKCNLCGGSPACAASCPTGAIVAPYELDARRCISYLTIEHKSAIPEELRPLIGNRVYGCDDCQLACPWNGFAQPGGEPDFQVRNGLDRATLVELFSWSEAEFDERLQGSPIRRIGYERWLRNLAVGLGNAPTSTQVVEALRTRADHPSALVREHVRWALSRHAGLAT